jgi:UDP-glucuronate 4-epimerase
MRVFITGHKGFVGNHLIKFLDAMGIEWEGYDIQENKNDIRDKYNLDFHIRRFNPHCVIHMAARAGVTESKIYPDEYISTNIIGTQNVVDICNKHKINKLIFFSSSSVFGKREDESPVKEGFLKKPSSLYGITKLAGEHIVNTCDSNTVIIRPFTIYGEEGRPDGVIYKWMNEIEMKNSITIYGDEDSYRGYVYVGDLCQALLKLLYTDLENKHEDFNLGGSEKIHLYDIVNVLSDYHKGFKKIHIDRPNEDIFGQVANTSKAKELIDFDPLPKFKHNLHCIVKTQYRKNPFKLLKKYKNAI